MQMAPTYLRNYADDYARDPRAAAREWFCNAKYGLFLHYGLYSLLGRGEWVQLREKIPVAEYAKLKNRFTAEHFDADAVAEFAVECGMNYVNLTTRHHDGFCLFETNETDFNSACSPAGRDLVKELAAACGKRRLGLCLYYSHGRDWRHPHAPNNHDWAGNARPEYVPPEPSYAYGAEHHLEKYLDFMTAQIRELLTGYGPIAAIWLDGIAVPVSGDSEKFRCQELYDLIHALQPQVLVAYKQGVTGTEDFFAPEHALPTAQDDNAKQGKIIGRTDTIIEICTSMTPGSWGHLESAKTKHKSAEDVWEALHGACRAQCNLLLNTGPLPGGSLDPEDIVPLRQVGERLKKQGFPCQGRRRCDETTC